MTVTEIFVKDFGAQGNGLTDDTAAIQMAVDAAAGKGAIVVVPAGIYQIDTDKRINLRSNMGMELQAGATLQAITNSSGSDREIVFIGAKNVTLTGSGVIRGDRYTHGVKPAKGFCVRISQASDVTVKGIVARDSTMDGFYISNSQNVRIENVDAYNNSRQGLSIISGSNIVVLNSKFRNTNGMIGGPCDGIDIEPDKGDVIDGVEISGCQLLNNAGAGIELAGKRGTVRRIKVAGCKFSGGWPIKVWTQYPGSAPYNNWYLQLMGWLGNYSKHPTTISIP